MNRSSFSRVILATFLIAFLSPTSSAQPATSYRLDSVDLQQNVIWGAAVKIDENTGLAFGGQDQAADDGRPHTRVLRDGSWKPIHLELRAKNPLQQHYSSAWRLRNEVRNLLAKYRAIYFRGLPEPEELKALSPIGSGVAAARISIEKLIAVLTSSDERNQYVQSQQSFARSQLSSASDLLPNSSPPTTAEQIQALHRAQIHIELAAEALDAEPPARALNCGSRRKETEPPANSIVYIAPAKKFILFGGDHLDYLTNDTWLFDAVKIRWLQLHPKSAPPPRANHNLTVENGIATLTGGYTYTSNTDYVGGQYRDLDDGSWTFDIAKTTWSGSGLVAPDSRTYRTGPFHPNYYLGGERPSREKFQEWLSAIPANKWVATNPPQQPRLNRDWGCARLDSNRDLMLRWSGGHSAHGGTDVPHFHFATNRWELPFPVEFPLGQLYSNTSYPNGFNFNLRPWITGHTYQNYALDVTTGLLIKAGRPKHTYVYDPSIGDWISRSEKPQAMQYNSCFYTLTLTATKDGVVCWDQYGKIHKYSSPKQEWTELELSGDELPGAYVDNSTITYDSNRNRALIFTTSGYQKPFDGQVRAVDIATGKVSQLSPKSAKLGLNFAFIDRCCYDPDRDIVLIATYLKDDAKNPAEQPAGKTATPAYDCKTNSWITLDIDYEIGERSGRVRRDFPHGRSCGLVYDTKRKLYWGTDTNSQIYVMKLTPTP
ncbi:MAG: hypothetical protein ACI9G1_000945 [Pirellulaceae bacterium]|jgi:hypothetical protein